VTKELVDGLPQLRRCGALLLGIEPFERLPECLSLPVH